MSSLLDLVDASDDEGVGEQKENNEDSVRIVRATVDEVYSSDEEEEQEGKGIELEGEEEEEVNPYRTLGAEVDSDGGDDTEDVFGAFEEAATMAANESKGEGADCHVVKAAQGEARLETAGREDDEQAEEQPATAAVPRLGIPPLSKTSIDVIKSAMQGLKLKPRLGADALADALLASGKARLGDEV